MSEKRRYLEAKRPSISMLSGFMRVESLLSRRMRGLSILDCSAIAKSTLSRRMRGLSNFSLSMDVVLPAFPPYARLIKSSAAMKVRRTIFPAVCAAYQLSMCQPNRLSTKSLSRRMRGLSIKRSLARTSSGLSRRMRGLSKARTPDDELCQLSRRMRGL